MDALKDAFKGLFLFSLKYRLDKLLLPIGIQGKVIGAKMYYPASYFVV